VPPRLPRQAGAALSQEVLAVQEAVRAYLEVYVKEVGNSTNTITIQPSDVDATIDGSSTVTITTAYGKKRLVAFKKDLWGEL